MRIVQLSARFASGAGLLLTPKRQEAYIRSVHLRRIRSKFVCRGKRLVFPMSKSTRMLYREFYRIQAAAGISERYRFKDMRSTGVSAYYERSPGGAQEMAEHSDLKTTRRHYFAPTTHLRELVDSHPQPTAFLE